MKHWWGWIGFVLLILFGIDGVASFIALFLEDIRKARQNIRAGSWKHIKVCLIGLAGFIGLGLWMSAWQ